jgi:ankyrin repeat protein
MVRVARLISALLAGAILLVVIVHAGAGDSAVTNAVKTGDLAGLRKLIAARSDVNAPSGDGSTPLLWAAYSNDVEMTRALIAAGAKVETANRFGVTPLLQASRTGDAAVMDVLLKAGADPMHAHPEGETPLMAASRSGHLDAVRLLLARAVDVNAVDAFQNESALMWASAEGHTEVVDALLTAGANPNLKGHVTSLTDRKNADHPTGGFTALMWAARNGHDDTIRRLAKGGADLSLTNGDGASATMIAIDNDRFDTAKTLIDVGANANDGSLLVAVEMRDGTTDQFAFDGSRLRISHKNNMTALDMVKYLLDHGADPNKPFSGQFHSTSMPNSDRLDGSPLFRAAAAGDAETLKVIAAHGADLDKTPVAAPAEPGARGAGPRGGGNANAGRTALMVAMTGGRGPSMTGGPGYIREGAVPYREPGSRNPVDAFIALLKGGANPNVKGPDGASVLHMAAQQGNLEMIRALAAAGAKLDITNNDGLTALDIAEGKRPAGAAAAAPRGGGPRGAPPVGGGPPGARRGRGASPADVAAELRKLMGLPPAPPKTEIANPAPAAGDAQQQEPGEAQQ